MPNVSTTSILSLPAGKETVDGLNLRYRTIYLRYSSTEIWWQKTKKAGDIISTDASDNPIKDPKNADRGVYKDFVGYYRVTLTEKQ